ncbi:hypothetical protein HTV45_03250 [Streptomyces sp. CHD11]|uniref:hypothetical protein n=1 Tax=Streptomyces sp. CHD11 TaxID=2741325 RepID=UPI001BFCAF1F|nr:hypothetical protein [Streptomyces sp. CHD11]MBT3149936.1 hypothetical protein [Streptomyces sp. CHD11]
MSGQEPPAAGPADGRAAGGGSAAAAAPGEPSSDETPKDGTAEESQGRDQPQNAWSARRDLVDHSPRTMRVGSRSAFGGGYTGGDQHGVSGGRVTGDVVMGSKTVHHWSIPGLSTVASAAGEIPRATLERLAASFVTVGDTFFESLVDRLRRDRVLVLSGARFTGRRTAALMLLHRVGATSVLALDRDTTPGSLPERFTARDGDGDTAARTGTGTGPDSAVGTARARGYVLCDLVTRRGNALRETHLLSAADRLAEQDAYAVITVGPTAVLEDDVAAADWRPPTAEDVLAAHLRVRSPEETVERLLGLPEVKEFLDHGHQLREVAAFAQLLGRYAAGEVTEQAVADFSLVSLENQVQEWFEEDESVVHLRDKAFLIALAAFDDGPYALTAELSDLLYGLLQQTENRATVPVIPVFGTHIGKRLQLARAERHEAEEHTEWGPVTQTKAAFHDERASLVLLREVWTGHPSARPALVAWLRHLADDGRPLVRTRAASTVAVLARTDLPSAMALVIEPWATSNLFRHRLVAVNSLTLAHHIGTPNIPRILDAWSTAEDRRLRWVAVRAYALIGPERPAQALAALRDATRALYRHFGDPDDFDVEMARELAEAVELLLLSPADEEVLAGLLARLDDERAVRDLSLGGFVNACRRTEGDDRRYGTPLVLSWYARASADDDRTAARGIARLWRETLGDPHYTGHALEVLRDWVLIASRSTTVEWALAALLPTLVTTPTEHQRLTHLLRTMPGEDGNPPPEVTTRLLSTLPPRFPR